MTRPAHCIALLAAAMAILLLPAAADARPKRDVIGFTNGDRITGEIIELKYGQLTVKTDSLGTVSIDWLEIATIDSPHEFLVETNSGERFHGRIANAAEAGRIRVAGQAEDNHLAIAQVAVVTQLEASFVNRIDGSVSLGFDRTKSSDVSSLSFSFDTEYRSDHNYASVDGYYNADHTPDLGTQEQYALSVSNQFLRPNDNFWLASVSYESNEQQGIDGRLLLGGARGHYWVRNATSEFATFSGLALTQEWASGGASNQQSTEGLLGLQWRIFRFSSPKTSMTSRLVVLPSLSDSGRYRSTATISLDHEVIKDFYVDLSFNGSYDSEPPDETALKTDYSVTTSLKYKF
ncbi:MAG: DUF481 domain-containing protein [Gammaproteobacteria bacterium]|nr:DUF481 domain-containing protein [Gammaproteobacteria bacterium]